ncbi:MAG: type III secretion system chaperone [Maricaulaceae bacterium]
MSNSRKLLFSVILAATYSVSACSQDATVGDSPNIEADVTIQEGVQKSTEDALMSGKKLIDLVLRLDEDADVRETGAVFEIAERELMMVFDSEAGRMRVISPIIQVSALPDGLMERMLQANYDSVLDARYAIANDIVWATFIHPLPSLTEDDFISALAQTVTAAESFGTTYTSGAMVFGGGDSSGIHEDLLKELQEANKARTDI